jgi:SulP family sulfate permease
MVEKHSVQAVLHSTRNDVIVFVLTAVGTVVFDLVKAVEAGLAVAVVLAVAHLAGTAQAVAEPLDTRDLDGIDDEVEHALLAAHVLTYRLDGPVFFAASARFLSQLTATTDVRVVILRLSNMAMLDATGARALGEIVEQLAERHIIVLLKGASSEHTRLLAAVGTLAPVLRRGHVFSDLPAAVAHARTHLRPPSADAGLTSAAAACSPG